MELFRRPTPEQVVRDHSADVLRLLRRIFGPHADVDDVFQAVFVEVIRSLPAFKGEAKLKTWIHRITLNVAYQEMRVQYREREVRSTDDLDTLPLDEEASENVFERAEQRRILYEGLRELSPKKRFAVILHDVEGCTLKEILGDHGAPAADRRLPGPGGTRRARRLVRPAQHARREAGPREDGGGEAMKTSCFKIREHLLDYHFGELDGLEEERVRLHLQNCDECRTVVERLGRAFTAAVDWEPEPKPGELDRLVERLTPYLQPEEEERAESSGWLFGVGLALAAGLALFMVYSAWKVDRPSFEATPVADQGPEKTLPLVEEVVRSQPTEHLRMVASKDWNGEVRRSNAKVTRVSMDRGFAVMAFDGGEGRRLIVETPEAEVEVVGTRFYVDARPGLATTIGVVAGKVVVKTNHGREMLASGTERAYGKDGRKATIQLARSNPFHSDSYLLEQAKPAAAPAPAPMIAKKRVDRRRSSKLLPRKDPPKHYEQAGRFLAPYPPDEPPPAAAPEKAAPDAVEDPDALDPTSVLNEADRLVRKGKYGEAVTLLEGAIDSEEPQVEPFRSMLRYERARILVKQGKREFARAEFGRLTQAKEVEVANQAKLSMCELELADDPCTAAACLRSIDSNESKQLLSRWKLDELDCDHHKNSAP